jgi:hypothetical protein
MAADEPHVRPALTSLNVTRDQVALRGLEQAVERIRVLERTIVATFEELERALEGCHSNGIEAIVRFDKPTDAAWAAWRNKGYADRT